MTAAAKSLHSCLTLCDPTDVSPPGSPIPGILQARTHGVGCHFLLRYFNLKNGKKFQDLLGSPVVRNPCFHCRGHGFDPWLEN